MYSLSCSEAAPICSMSLMSVPLKQTMPKPPFVRMSKAVVVSITLLATKLRLREVLLYTTLGGDFCSRNLRRYGGRAGNAVTCPTASYAGVSHGKTHGTIDSRFRVRRGRPGGSLARNRHRI